MSPKKKAKPSPSSQSDTTIPTLFLDECFGSGIVLKGLRAAGYRVVSPSQSSEVVAGELDEEWLPKAEKNKWIVLTKDNAMRRRHLRTEGTNNYEIILFILRGKNMRGEDMLAALLSAL
ncbi:hypothetical protein KAI87_16585, partial [Myxococcota bacterium]|nr:hypothetical protein [Myxococcota bacterium]